jgi:hypothetical protein
MQNYYVLAILTDKHGKTIGARLQKVGTAKTVDVTTEQLVKNRNTFKLSSAIIDKNGFVRSKRGNSLTRIIRNTTPTAEEQFDITQTKKLLQSSSLLLYHGNKDPNMRPQFGIGADANDCGQGFYTTPVEELGKEWVWAGYTKGEQGYLHTYELNLMGLRVLKLSEMDSIHWIAELLAHRKINVKDEVTFSVAQRNIEKLVSKYKIDTSSYDIIVGYRADDSYFRYAEAFALGLLYKEDLDKALHLGHLGLQVFIKSPKAFNHLRLLSVEPVDIKYKQAYQKRDVLAREQYKFGAGQKRRTTGTTIYDFIGVE